MNARTALSIPDPRAMPRLLLTDDGPSLDAHFRRWGQLPAGGPLLIDEVERAGLRGRGGAQFPTATKLRAVAAARPSVVVANGTEGEPASSKDKVILVHSPHLVLDGASIAADTVGADEAIVCVDRAADAALSAVGAALAERLATSADRVTFRVQATPSHYVTGEESALVHWLNGGDAKPTFVPPRPFERGVRGRPTLVNNVETLAHLALIARFGADWFRGLGTAEDPARRWSPLPATSADPESTNCRSAFRWRRPSELPRRGTTPSPSSSAATPGPGSLARPWPAPDSTAAPCRRWAPALDAAPSPWSAPAPAACGPPRRWPAGWPISRPASADPAPGLAGHRPGCGSAGRRRSEPAP